MEETEKNTEAVEDAEKIEKPDQSVWLGIIGGVVIIVVFSIWLVNDLSYEPLLGILTGIAALISFIPKKNVWYNWLLMGGMVVVAMVGIVFIRRANDPEKIVIVGIFYDGVKAQEGDEYVLIRNEDARAIQLEGWTLNDNQMNHVFTFPRYEMQPGDECRIYTDEDHPDSCGFNFRNGGSGVWNNNGDMATLRNADGLIIDSSIDLILTEGGAIVEIPEATETPPTATERVADEMAANGKIVIVDIIFDGEKGEHEPDEYVVIRNDEAEGIQLQGWTLRDESDHIFIFPDFTIKAGEICRIYTNEDHPEWCGFNYGSGQALWGNSGDCATLRNREDEFVGRFCY